MINQNSVHPVADFNRNTPEHIKRLKETGQPEFLTVDGAAEIVVQSAEGYQKLLDAADLAQAVAGIRTGQEQANAGQGRPMREFLDELAQKNGFTLE